MRASGPAVAPSPTDAADVHPLAPPAAVGGDVEFVLHDGVVVCPLFGADAAIAAERAAVTAGTCIPAAPPIARIAGEARRVAHPIGAGLLTGRLGAVARRSFRVDCGRWRGR